MYKLPDHVVVLPFRASNINEKYRLDHPWNDRVDYVEWRTNDESKVKVYDQKKTVDYADYRVGLIYIDPCDLFVEGEPVMTKLDRKRKSDVVDLFRGD